MKNMVIIGPPGSGKDTQIDEMRKLLDFEVISTGEIARTLAEKDESHRLVVEAGGLLADDVMTKELSKRLDNVAANMGVVFDGYPRTLHQAELLNEILLRHDRVLDTVIYLSLEEAAVVERLTARRICSDCGHNIGEADICPVCGGKPTKRHDDEPAVIINRVQTFLENTLPLINYYRNKGILLEVNGDQSVKAVAEDIKEKLGYV